MLRPRIEIDQTRLKRIKNLVRQLSNGIQSGLWDKVTDWLENIKEDLFDNLGGDYGRAKWPKIAPTMWGRLRRGSDGQIYGRYSSGTVPLQASGAYRKSFKAKMSPKTLTYGSRLRKKLGTKIPYGGWNNKEGKYVPRYALPDMFNRKTKKELNKIYKQTIKEWLKGA